jgi:hypothetical protein
MHEYDAIAGLLTAALPELGETCYIVPGSAAPDALGTIAGGMTGRLLPFRLRPYLLERGLWRGPQYFGCIIADEPELVDFGFDPLAVAIHEVGHHFDSTPIPLTEEKLASAPEHLQRFVTNDMWAQSDEVYQPPPEPWLLWGDHGLPFLRACAHVFYRVSQVTDRFICERKIIDSRRYGLTNIPTYFAAMRDEVRERAHEPVAEIIKTEPPAAAAALFQSDCDRFYSQEGIT